jgi:hypothetical protein
MGPNMGQFAPSWCGSQTVSGDPDEKYIFPAAFAVKKEIPV